MTSKQRLSIKKSASIYEEQGLVHLPDFLSSADLAAIQSEIAHAEILAMQELAEKWGNKKLAFFSRNPLKSGDIRNAENFVVDPYFQSSADHCHVFFEEIDRQIVLNRMGHGLHLHPNLKRVSQLIYDNSYLHSLLKHIGYRRPICLLSVYIPKLPHGQGSEVRPHQESAYAHTNPLSTCVLWVALEDATQENACMYGLRGSHTLPLKFVSQVDHERGERNYVKLNEVEIPAFNPAGSVYSPLETMAGEALLFHGNYVHCSPQNISKKSRKALSFQFIETDKTMFSPFNWIRSPKMKPLYE